MCSNYSLYVFIMEKIRAEAIEGGQFEASLTIKRAFEGNGKLSGGMINRVCAQLDLVDTLPLNSKLFRELRLPLADLVAMVWRLKEIEQAELGAEGENLFLESAENVQLGVDWQVEMKRRIVKTYRLNLHNSNVEDLRRTALPLAAKLEETLDNCAKVYNSLLADDELMVEFLAGDLPLFWEIAINLHQTVGALLDTAKSMVASLKFSLRMIGAPVMVNQEIWENVYVSLAGVIRVLRQMRAIASEGGAEFSERDRLKEVMDTTYVFPQYHYKLSEALSKTELLMGNGENRRRDDYVANALMLKQNYLEQNYQEAARFWVAQELDGPLAVGTSIEEQPDCRIDCSLESAALLVPRHLLVLVRLALDHDLLQDAEELMRAYILANNLVNTKDYQRLDALYRDWRHVESKIAQEIRQNRRGILKLV